MNEAHARAVAAGAGGWLQAHSLTLVIVGVVVGTVSVVAGWRRHRLALGERQECQLLPTETFAPDPEEIRRWAAALYSTYRRRDWARRSSEGVRFGLSSDGGLVRQTIESSRRVMGLLEPHVPHEVELIRPESLAAEGVPEGVALVDEVPGTGASTAGWASRLIGRRGGRGRRRRGDPIRVQGTRMVRARGELRVAPDQSASLAELALNPDPLTPLVTAMAELNPGECASVVLDLQPLAGLKLKRARKKARARDKSRPDWVRTLTQGQWLNDDPLSKSTSQTTMSGTSKQGALARLEARSETVSDHDRFAAGEPVFAAQLLVTVDAESRARARAMVAALAAGLAPMNQRAAWRRVGVVVGPWRFGGPDSRSRCWRFDHRAETGCFHPAKPSIVGAAEIAGLIKPPTANCHSPKVERGGGLVPPPPAGLPTWSAATRGVFPLGEVTERGVKRWIGVSLLDTLFTMMFGKAGFGKTGAAMVAMIALAREESIPGGRASGLRPGFLFLDPHGDGLTDLKPYLVEHADRVRIIDLRRRKGAAQAGWNPLSMVGRDADDIEDIVSMMVAGFSAVLGWSEVNNRAQNLVTQAVSSLCTLGRNLPPDLQPTIFQIPTILTDEKWREEVLPFLTPHQVQFWTSRLATQTDAKSATSPVTNLCDRLRGSSAMVGLFGQPSSTFDMRASMDNGDIILVCPGGAGDKEQMAHVLILFELFRAAVSRNDIDDKDDRRPFHAFLDEIQIADRGAGSLTIARMFQEVRKFRLVVHAMAQQPNALSKSTLQAIADNRSHLSSTTVGAESGTWLSSQFAKAVDPATMTRIRRWHRIVSVAHNGTISLPFRVRNLSMIEAWGPPASADAVAALEATVDRTMRRRPVGDVSSDLDTLDSRILAHLTGRPPGSPRPSATADAVEVAPRRRAPVVRPSGPGTVIPPADLPDGVASIDRARGNWRAE